MQVWAGVCRKGDRTLFDKTFKIYLHYRNAFEQILSSSKNIAINIFNNNGNRHYLDKSETTIILSSSQKWRVDFLRMLVLVKATSIDGTST